MVESVDGTKICLKDGRSVMRTLTPKNIQMDINQFFENCHNPEDQQV